MRFDTSQSMKLGQQMKLAPRMIQSMEILAMPLAQLEERIEEELESNATLELVEAEADQSLDQERREQERDARDQERELIADDGSDFERLESFEQSNPDYADYLDRPSRSTRLEGERDAKMDAMASAPARSASLTDQLLAQWSLIEVDESLRSPGVLIITFLEDDGYLRTPLETIIERAPEPPSVEVMENALRAVQLFMEPAGIAARDARECLLLQIDATEEPDEGLRIARTLVEDHLDDILQNRLPRVAERSRLTIEEVKEGLQALRRLSLAPARQLIDESEPTITPDAIIEYDEEDDRYIAYLNETRLPNLQINREYAKLAKEKETPRKDKDFLKTNLSNAQWLIDAVQQRRQTLLRVINVVVDAQREYFDFGPEALRPLPMTQVADQLGIHVATVSRAVAEKYLETPRGIVPLRSFFTGGLQTESGEDVSYDAVRAALKETIDKEDKSKPFSDEALVRELKKKGIEIARRTVAKYRAQMDIQSARLRKQF